MRLSHMVSQVLLELAGRAEPQPVGWDLVIYVHDEIVPLVGDLDALVILGVLDAFGRVDTLALMECE